MRTGRPYRERHGQEKGDRGERAEPECRATKEPVRPLGPEAIEGSLCEPTPDSAAELGRGREPQRTSFDVCRGPQIDGDGIEHGGHFVQQAAGGSALSRVKQRSHTANIEDSLNATGSTTLFP